MVSFIKALSLSAFITLLALVSGSGIKDDCERAFRACDWTFRGVFSVPTFSIRGQPDVPISPPIISKDPREKLGVLNTNGIAPEFIFRGGRFASITRFGNPPLTPTHFKPLFIPRSSASGVGFQTFDGNQLRVARRQCVRLFFTSYQRFVGPPELVQNINVGRSANKCVVFRTA